MISIRPIKAAYRVDAAVWGTFSMEITQDRDVSEKLFGLEVRHTV